MKEDVNKYIESCKSCNEIKTNPSDKLKAPIVITNSPQAAFETVHIDVVGPLPVTIDNNLPVNFSRCIYKIS